MASIAAPTEMAEARALYGAGSRLFRAPGRVNLIGEHTDYNDGFVMPAAIGFSTWIIAAPRPDRKLRLRSENFGEKLEFDLDQAPQPRGDWSDYIRGVAMVLERAGKRLTGADLYVHGEVPIGSGLSSSAAIEVASGFALLSLSGHSIDRVELARLCQMAENEFVGARCGIMDQFISCNGQAGHALMLDCRSLQFRLLPLPEEAALVICNTMVKHEISGGEYNTRREQCEAGVRHLSRSLPGIRALRDVTLEQLEQHKSGMDEVVYRRCRHVIRENDRVESAAAALEAGDLKHFGELMADSHSSLRDDYEVSCPELDLMVSLAAGQPGVYGARMTGGGFGGCTINLVAQTSAAAFKTKIAADYEAGTGRQPEIYVCTAAEGAEEVLD